MKKIKPKSSGFKAGDDVWSRHYGQGYIIELLDKKGYKGDAMVSFNLFSEHIHVAVKSLVHLGDIKTLPI